MLSLRLTLLIGTVAAMAFGQDITGRWAGSADWTDGGGTKRTQSTTVEIKSEAGKFTAHSVGSNGKIGAPLQIQIDGTKVNLYRFLELDGGEHLRWKLELKDGKLTGSFSAQHDNPKKWMYDRLLDLTMTTEK